MENISISSIRFSFTNYNTERQWQEKKCWHVEVAFNSPKGNMKSAVLDLDGGIAEELIVVILPIMTASASKAAVALAEEAKAQAQSIAAMTTKQLTNVKENLL